MADIYHSYKEVTWRGTVPTDYEICQVLNCQWGGLSITTHWERPYTPFCCSNCGEEMRGESK